MKLLCLLVACCCVVQAQAQIILSGKINNHQPGSKLVVNVPFDAWYHAANSIEVQPDAQGSFSVEVPVSRAQTIFLDYGPKRLYLYAQPKATLTLTFTGSAFPASLAFGGSLKKENRFRQELGLTEYRLGAHAWDDTLTAPAQIMQAVSQNQATALRQLERRKRHFSASFYQMAKADIQYFAPAYLWRLMYANNVWGRKNLSRFGQEEWRNALQEIHAAVPLSSPEAVPSYFYQEVLAYYPRYLQLSGSKEEFARLVETMFRKPFQEARKEIKEKGERYWEHAALVYGLQGAALESALASFLNNGIYQGELGYQQEAYDDFRRRFPQSPYRPYLEQLMQPFWKSQGTGALPGLQVEKDSDQFQSLPEILQAHRGKVVYVDLWGSWCGPCREEFRFSKALRERFQGKEVDFLYIAFEHSANPEKTWQETIRFYELAGRHVLGTKALERYFQELYGQEGTLSFPAYLLIDKEGNIVTTRAARPSGQEALYKQIEALL